MSKATDILKMFNESSDSDAFFSEIERVRGIVKKDTPPRKRKININTNLYVLFLKAYGWQGGYLTQVFKDMMTKYNLTLIYKTYSSSVGQSNTYYPTKGSDPASFEFWASSNSISPINSFNADKTYTMTYSMELFIEPQNGKEGQVLLEMSNTNTKKSYVYPLPFYKNKPLDIHELENVIRKNFEVVFKDLINKNSSVKTTSTPVITTQPSSVVKPVKQTMIVTNNITTPTPVSKPSVPESPIKPVEENGTVDDVILYLKSFRYKLPQSSSGDWDRDPQISGKDLTFGVRHWGDWYIPDEDRYDPDNEESDFEDYDNESLSDKYYKIANDTFNKYMKDCPYNKLLKNYSIQTGEKNWLYFEVTLK